MSKIRLPKRSQHS